MHGVPHLRIFASCKFFPVNTLTANFSNQTIIVLGFGSIMGTSVEFQMNFLLATRKASIKRIHVIATAVVKVLQMAFD